MLTAYRLTSAWSVSHSIRDLLDTALTVGTQIKGSDRDGKPHVKLSDNDKRILLFDPVDEIHYAVFDEDGTPIAGQREVPRPLAAIASGRPVFYDAPLSAQPMRWVAIVAEQMDEDDRKPIRALIVIGETLHKREALSRRTLYLTSLPQIGLVVLLGVFVWFGLQRGLRPMHELRRHLQTRSEADLHPIDFAAMPAKLTRCAMR